MVSLIFQVLNFLLAIWTPIKTLMNSKKPWQSSSPKQVLRLWMCDLVVQGVWNGQKINVCMSLYNIERLEGCSDLSLTYVLQSPGNLAMLILVLKKTSRKHFSSMAKNSWARKSSWTGPEAKRIHRETRKVGTFHLIRLSITTTV